MVATWNPEVITTPDPAHDGSPTPGLAGRVYLFGEQVGCPLKGDGSMVVALYDDAAMAAGNAGKPLEEWRFDRDTLQRLLRRDFVGWGYTLFLPWSTYKPEIARVHVKVRYIPGKGAPLYAASAPITLGDTAHNIVLGQELAGATAKAQQKPSGLQTTSLQMPSGPPKTDVTVIGNHSPFFK